MQFTKRDWRNRNLITTKNGLQWLTIPVITKGKYNQTINETIASGNKWREEHWKTLVYNYSKAEHFKNYRDVFEKLYLSSSEPMLTKINITFIRAICDVLGIKTKLSFSGDYDLIGDKTERLVNLCKQSKAQEYITGPSARNYIEDRLFSEANIKLTYFDYSGYPKYKQLFGKFEHTVSILDLIFNIGKDSIKYMKSFTPTLSSDSY